MSYGFYLVGNMQQVIEAINTRSANEQEIQIFSAIADGMHENWKQR